MKDMERDLPKMPEKLMNEDLIDLDDVADKIDQPFGSFDKSYEFRFVKVLDKDIKLEPDASPKKETKPIELFDNTESHVDKQFKLNDGKAKKIRRLELESHEEKRRQATGQPKSFPFWRIFFVVSTVSAVAMMYINPDMKDEIIQHSITEYNVLRHGKTYCTNPLDSAKISNILRDEIIGQDAAIGAIESALKDTKSSINSLIFYGPTGSGKTLTSQLISRAFPWRENSQTLIYHPDAKFDLSTIVRKMSTCGTNLFIIDDLHSLNRDMLNIRDALVQATAKKDFKLILIFIFNSQTDTLDGIDTVKGHHVIHFRNMDNFDLDKCMARVEQELAVRLTAEQRDTVRANVDVTKSGCKTIRSKMSLYMRDS